MKIREIRTKYVGDQEGFQVELGAYINKSTCGCGVTHYLLSNDENVILAVPKKHLIANKCSQMDNILGVDGSTTKDEIEQYAQNTQVIKIMTTYDSLHKVQHLIGLCRVVVDETQDLFNDYKNKTNTTTGKNLYRVTMGILEKHKDITTFVSATPPPVQYFPKWVQELEQVTYKFKFTVKKQPILIQYGYPLKALYGAIIKPMLENGSVTIKNKTFSKVVVYYNSVSAVKYFVDDYQVNPNDISVYCGDTIQNDAYLTDLGVKRFTGLNDLNKINFVTSSGWSGVDFYDDDAMAIVVSNTKKDWQMVDINTDLQQAISRIRNSNNPNNDTYIFIYNNNLFDQSEEELLQGLNNAKEGLETALVDFKKSAQSTQQKYFLTNAEFNTYTTVNDAGERVIDEISIAVDRYFALEVRTKFMEGFEMSTNDDRFYKFEQTYHISYNTILNKVQHHKPLTDEEKNSNWYALITKYYDAFGCYTTDSYAAKSRLEKLNTNSVSVKLEMAVQASFNKYTKYPVSDVKNTLQKLYNDYGIARKAKATDLSEFAECEFGSMRINGQKAKCVTVNSWKTNFIK